MANNTAIEWTDATWNPVVGCSVVSPGCTHCYAMKLAGGRLQNHPSRAGLTQPSKAGPVWTGKVRLWEPWLTQPFKWKTPRRIFVCAHGDLFHEDVPDEWIDKVFAVMALAPQHTFQVLTKRAKRMRDYLGHLPQVRRRWERVIQDELGEISLSPPPVLHNVWLGVSTEDQATADERIPHLLATPAAKRFISVEPLLGAININDAMWAGTDDPLNNLDAGIDWVIAGGESGPRARPAHPDWFRSLRDQCAAANVPFFFKQWGEYVPCEMGRNGVDTFSVIASDGEHLIGQRAIWGKPGDAAAEIIAHVGKKRAGAQLDGKMHREFPR